MDQQNIRTDITVNVEGFWLLQALLDIRHVAPELRCRPFVSTSESTDWLKDHPGIAVMREQKIIVNGAADLAINEEVEARMRVLAVPDIEVVALLSHGKLRYGVSDEAIQQHEAREADGQQGLTAQPVGSRDIPDNEFRVVLARRDDRWVSAVRVGADITVDDVSVTDAASIAALVTGAMESINHADPAAITAVNVPLEEMLSATKNWQSSGFNVFSSGDLRRMGLTAATIAALGQALSEPVAEAAVYARQYRDDARESSASVLSLKDGSTGRIAMYQQARTVGSGQKWLAICPATPQLVQVGVQTVLDTVPFGAWRTHRRV